MTTEGTFYEDDELASDVVAAFDAGMMKLSDVAWDDEQDSLDEVAPCEFSTGEVLFQSHKPTVTLCGRPGTARRGIMWCEVYACDDCYSRWLASPRRGHTRTRTRDSESDVES